MNLQATWDLDQAIKRRNNRIWCTAVNQTIHPCA
jgi:hypothetical protein